jgi:catechol 2,3-dioxygenase
MFKLQKKKSTFLKKTKNMKRKQFITGILGTSILLSMEEISTLVKAKSLEDAKSFDVKDDIATFGAVHLNSTSIEKAIPFWTNVIGMKLRSETDSVAEFGSESKTLVVIYQTATASFKEGYSGLYHFAIHLPNKEEFAKAIYRLQQNKYAFSPIDHTMTQSLYLNDFDNVMVELALETPERFKRVITEGGLFMEDVNGTIRGASAQLDTEEILKSLIDKDLSKILIENTKIGHIHFYANNVALNNEFYKKLGFNQSNYFPQYKFADLGAGGPYLHRVAMNSWHGNNKPLAPITNAGLEYYHIVFKSKELLEKAVQAIGNTEVKDESYWTKDPTGITINLSHS